MAKVSAFEFGPFQLDAAQQQLRRRGIRLKLSASRLRLLVLFLTRRGELITRDEIAACLWSDSQNVDVVSGINTAVNQLRAQLGDDPASPKYIETVIGSGYRFIASVTEVESPAKTAVQLIEEETATETVELPTVPSEPPLPISNRGHLRKGTAVMIAAAVVLCAAILYFLFRTPASPRNLPQAELRFARVTETGDVQSADLSPDSNYLIYVRDAGGVQLLVLQQLATGRALELAKIGEDECPGLAFSPDGSYVYFVRKKPLEPSGDLYRIPLLGGVPTRVASGVSGPPAISPDGHSVAFVRSTLETHGVDSIVTASLDGSHEQVLASYNAPGIHLNRISFTSNGQSLVFALQSNLVSIPRQGGEPHTLPGAYWADIEDVRQLPQSNNLIVVGRLSNSSNAQIFEISPAGGKPRKITNDLSDYTEIRVAADGKTLLALQHLILSTVQVLTPGHESENHFLHAENQNLDGVNGMAWTPEGNLVYVSQPEGHQEIMEANGFKSDKSDDSDRSDQSNGSNSRLIADSELPMSLSDPAVSPRGNFIAAVRWMGNDEANIWRMTMDGVLQTRLTSGKQDFPPDITPDGQWVVYGSVQSGHSVLMKVSSQGGAPIPLTDYDTDFPSVSPDGKWIAAYRIPHQNQPASLAIIPMEGGPPAKVFELTATALHRITCWTPHGREIAFINSVKGVGNIWQQPISGGPPAPVTHFTSGKIFNFRWSRSGRLALSRGTETIDAVMIRNFREGATN